MVGKVTSPAGHRRPATSSKYGLGFVRAFVTRSWREMLRKSLARVVAT
jgi:hypothetical protein